MPAEQDRRRSVQSVEVGFRIFIALAEAEAGWSLGALATRLDMAPAKAHRYLQSLITTGLARQDAASGRYQLGAEALRVGLAALSRLNIAEAASAPLAALREALNQTCFLAVPASAGATVVRIEQPHLAITVNIRLGSVLASRRSATGRAVLAFGPVEPDDPVLAEARRQGVVGALGTLIPGMDAIAAPVRDHTGTLAGVLTVLGPHGGFDPDPAGEAAGALRRAAATVSRALGHETWAGRSSS